MALPRRIVTCFVKNHHLRYFSDRAGSNFWEIVHKQWRTPRFSSPNPDSLKAKLAPTLSTVRIVTAFNPFVPQKWNIFKRNSKEEEQGLTEVLESEAENRGPSTSVGQYLVFRGAKVRFSSFPEWIDSENNYDKLPSVKEINNVLTGIDISYLDFDYSAVKAIQDLNSVTIFNAQGCKYFDDYCYDYITGALPSLEELNLSYCPLITSRGLGATYRLKRLRSLKLNGVTSDAELELLSVLLEEHFPNLQIEGVTYQVDKRHAQNLFMK